MMFSQKYENISKTPILYHHVSIHGQKQGFCIAAHPDDNVENIP